MDFFEAVDTRHSIRDFGEDPVAQEHVLAMLGAATLAPSATNEQPWHFIVIRDGELKESMRDVVNAVTEAPISAAGDSARAERLARMRRYGVHFAAAPVVIAVLARPWTGGSGDAQPDSTSRDLGVQSVSMAVNQLLLAATALGYGSCYSSAPAEIARRELEALLGIEQPWFLLGIISVGVAAQRQRRRAPRKDVTDVTTFIG
jgi:nitroreductase